VLAAARGSRGCVQLQLKRSSSGAGHSVHDFGGQYDDQRILAVIDIGLTNDDLLSLFHVDVGGDADVLILVLAVLIETRVNLQVEREVVQPQQLGGGMPPAGKDVLILRRSVRGPVDVGRIVRACEYDVVAEESRETGAVSHMRARVRLIGKMASPHGRSRIPRPDFS